MDMMDEQINVALPYVTRPVFYNSGGILSVNGTRLIPRNPTFILVSGIEPKAIILRTRDY
jgi:hypothetical protein